MARVFNFFPGPGALPIEAIRYAKEEFEDFQGMGMSLLETSHRTDAYENVHNEATALVRELMEVPDNYHILWLQGGASQQFFMIPMNLLSGGKSADYIMTGTWTQRAFHEANIVAKARVAATSEPDSFNYIPKELDLDPNAGYVHLTSNNTIMGTQYFEYPDTGDAPLIADMSSDIMCRKVDVNQFGIIFAGAHKNLGPAGATIMIIRDDLVEKCEPNLPTLLKYSTHIEHNCMFNTPIPFTIYMVRNVMKWMKEKGGVAYFEEQNKAKGKMLYEFLDSTDGFYNCPIAKEDRSIMNVVFNMATPELEDRFAKEAWNDGFVGLKNLPMRGGNRISMYNAVPIDWIEKLIDYMKEFMRKNG